MRGVCSLGLGGFCPPPQIKWIPMSGSGDRGDDGLGLRKHWVEVVFRCLLPHCVRCLPQSRFTVVVAVLHRSCRSCFVFCHMCLLRCRGKPAWVCTVRTQGVTLIQKAAQTFIISRKRDQKMSNTCKELVMCMLWSWMCTRETITSSLKTPDKRECDTIK